MEPELQKYAGEVDGKVNVVKIDFDASPDLAEKYSVTALPTLVLLKDGEEAGRLSSIDMGEIKALVDSAM